MGVICSAAISLLLLSQVVAFWEEATTTMETFRTDLTPRQSFFRWQWTLSTQAMHFFTDYDWEEIANRKRLTVIAGISIGFLPLSTGVLLNRRVVLTAANFLEPYQNRQRELRIWALGREGIHTTPYRYRVWRTRRLFPKSENPEHVHGPRGTHVPRHDISVVHSYDQIYIHDVKPDRYLYAWRALLTGKHDVLDDYLWYAGSGYEYIQHIKENYKIFYAESWRDDIVDCSRFLPKWWGKFICIRNTQVFPGIQNGAGLFSGREVNLVGIGCFEIRYNEDRIFAFTDLRYYVDKINVYANITRGEYYEYAYPEWSVSIGYMKEGSRVNYQDQKYMPTWQIQDDMFPLGK